MEFKKLQSRVANIYTHITGPFKSKYRQSTFFFSYNIKLKINLNTHILKIETGESTWWWVRSSLWYHPLKIEKSLGIRLIHFIIQKTSQPQQADLNLSIPHKSTKKYRSKLKHEYNCVSTLSPINLILCKIRIIGAKGRRIYIYIYMYTHYSI